MASSTRFRGLAFVPAKAGVMSIKAVSPLDPDVAGKSFWCSAFRAFHTASAVSPVSRRARVQSQVEQSEPEGNLDGFLARLHDSGQNEGKS